jgi:hypothetical protein
MSLSLCSSNGNAAQELRHVSCLMAVKISLCGAPRRLVLLTSCTLSVQSHRFLNPKQLLRLEATSLLVSCPDLHKICRPLPFFTIFSGRGLLYRVLLLLHISIPHLDSPPILPSPSLLPSLTSFFLSLSLSIGRRGAFSLFHEAL